ncbi:MAG: response regulator [Oligoflexales bacterium]
MDKEKVLVIDDSKSVRAAVRFALKSLNLDIIDAEDGAQALELLNTEKQLKLAICDVNMPNLNGIELLEARNRRKIAPNVIFLMLTTANTRDLVTKAVQLGVKAWIIKPFTPEQLRSTVAKFLKTE